MHKPYPAHLTVRPSNATSLRALFRSLTQIALASGAVGCSSSNTPPITQLDASSRPAPVEDSGPADAASASWDPIACAQGPSTVVDAKTTRSVDYLAIYRQYVDSFSPPSDAGPPTWTGPVAVMGTPCSGAANLEACEEEHAQITWCTGTCEPFMIAGAGGTFERLDSRAEVLELLGDVDAVADAVLLAIYDGHTLCSSFESDQYDLGGEVRAVRDGYETQSTWEECGNGFYREELTIGSDGKIEQRSYEKLGESQCAIGRRPFGLCDGKPTPSRTSIGAYLSQAAHLEAASVYAFQKLVRELESFGAPQALIDAAIDAIEDELAHTRDVARLARAYGASTALPEVAPSPMRSKLEVALDNISEGCVRETFGAVVATYQAECASDPRVRAVMRKIAEDETQHARFSWELQAWLASELSEEEAKLVEAEKTRAMALLAQAFESGLQPEEDRALGFPSVEAASSLFNGLRQTLWRAQG